MRSPLAFLIVVAVSITSLIFVHEHLGGIFAWYIGASIGTFVVYLEDKIAAGNETWRTSEATLHVSSLIGGWPGGLLGILALRHKSNKRDFLVIFIVTVIANCFLLYAFIRLRDSDVHTTIWEKIETTFKSR
ncbi:hypothetical protein DdX_09956 [Ditylenchus destructor]|uniref:DUF1294 domain-containing protein n=1 Tax=Ditylenchus destructor TaxID=166010 RepID=A0AAD4R632_9BILA|nr:hypothetical protein DdX_09956 [Ditylenchus destructor]